MRNTIVYNVIVNYLSDSWCRMWGLPHAAAKYQEVVVDGVRTLRPVR